MTLCHFLFTKIKRYIIQMYIVESPYSKISSVHIQVTIGVTLNTLWFTNTRLVMERCPWENQHPGTAVPYTIKVAPRPVALGF